MKRVMGTMGSAVAVLTLALFVLPACKDATKGGAAGSESAGREGAATTCTGEQLCDIGTKCGGFPSKEVCMQKSKEASDACPHKEEHTKCACDCYAKASPASDCALWQRCATECFSKHCGGPGK